MLGRIRFFAALLSILSLLVASGAWIQGGALKEVVALIFASACLAIVSPFDAPERKQRTRVLIACLCAEGAVAAALALRYVDAGTDTLVIALVVLVQLSNGLTCWVLATRNRRRKTLAECYFDK